MQITSRTLSAAWKRPSTTQTPRKRRRSMLKTSSTRLNEWERKDTKSGSSWHRIRCRAVIMSGHTIHSHENHIISFNHHTMRVLFLQQAHPPGHVMEMIIGYAQDVVPPTGGDSRYLTYIVRFHRPPLTWPARNLILTTS